jgi:hypothetical protein
MYRHVSLCIVRHRGVGSYMIYNASGVVLRWLTLRGVG